MGEDYGAAWQLPYLPLAVPTKTNLMLFNVTLPRGTSFFYVIFFVSENLFQIIFCMKITQKFD